MLPTHLGNADNVVDDAEFPGDGYVIGEMVKVVGFKPVRFAGADHRHLLELCDEICQNSAHIRCNGEGEERITEITLL